MIEFAFMYAKAGYSVIPVSRHKKPLIKFADRPTLTESDIKHFWAEFPDANIALKTDCFFAVDIDVHGEKNGYESIEAYPHKNLLIPTASQFTASGGKQLFYLKPQNMTIQQRIGWLDGVDIKAHVNNYVVVPPSYTDTGVYRWDLDGKNTMQEAPTELVKKINESQSSLTPPVSYEFSGEKTRTAELFEIIVEGFGDEGGRNDNLTRFVGGLLMRQVEIDAVYQLAQLANENTPDPLDEKEFERTFESMVRKEMRRRGWDD